MHRISAERLDVPSVNPTFTGNVIYAYDPAGKVTSITYPCYPTPCVALVAAYTYDSLGRPVQVDYGGSKYVVLSYDPYGRVDNIHYWKGATDTLIEEKYVYDARDRVTQIKVYKYGTTTKYMQLDYVYNKASEITSSTDDMFTGTPKPVSYSYDGNGRLWQAVGPFGTSEAQQYYCYNYDAVGNLLTWVVGAASCTTGATTYTYGYGASPAWNRLDSFSYNSMLFQWNPAGSMTCKTESSVKTRYVYNYHQQLVALKTGSLSCTSTETPTYTYRYDGSGRRVYTNDGTTTSYFMYGGDKMLYSRVSSAGGGTTETAFVYVGDRLLFRKEGAGSTPEARYYHQDISGNVREISYYSTSIQVEAKYRYKPFGDLIVLVTPSTDPRFKFAHQEFDASVRLYHMGARYYDPVVGRFIQRDPIGPGYGYAFNNPVSFIDPSGLVGWLGNFILWTRSPTGRTTIFLLTTIAAVALAIPSGGTSVAIMLAAGLVVGVIFVAATYVISGGRASFDDYYAAFALGFAVGVTIADVALLFQSIGRAALAAAGAAREFGSAARAEARLVQAGTEEGRLAAAVERTAPKVQRAAEGGISKAETAHRVAMRELRELERRMVKLRNEIDDMLYKKFLRELDDFEYQAVRQDLAALDTLPDVDVFLGPTRVARLGATPVRAVIRAIVRYAPIEVGGYVFERLWEQTAHQGPPLPGDAWPYGG